MMLSKLVERESQKNDRIAAATRRLQEKPDAWLQAVKYGYSLKEAARLNRQGWTYEFGNWVRYETYIDYIRVRMIFLDHKTGKVRYTWAVAESRIKALRRAYSYKRGIIEQGSVNAHFQMHLRRSYFGLVQ